MLKTSGMLNVAVELETDPGGLLLGTLTIFVNLEPIGTHTLQTSGECKATK